MHMAIASNRGEAKASKLAQYMYFMWILVRAEDAEAATSIGSTPLTPPAARA